MRNKIKDQIGKGWSDTERWVWEKIRSGQIADFNEKTGNKVNTEAANDWEQIGTERLLSAKFLENILSEEYFLREVTVKGFRIAGAIFKGDINLQHLKLERQLWMENCRFEGSLKLMNFYINDWFSLEGSWIKDAIDLNGAQFNSFVSLKYITVKGNVDMIGVNIGAHLQLDSSTFEKELIMNSVKIGGSLYMRDKCNFNHVNLQTATVEGVVEMDSSFFNDKLDMTLINIGGYLSMCDKASFNGVFLSNAKIDGNLLFRGSTFKDSLNMNSVSVGGSVFMDEKTKFKKILMRNANLQGSLYMTGSDFSEVIDMNFIKVDGTVFLNNAIFNSTIDLVSSTINGNIELTHSEFNDHVVIDNSNIGMNLLLQHAVFKENKRLDIRYSKVASTMILCNAILGHVNLTSTRIQAELHLGSYEKNLPEWYNSSKLILWNTTVGALQDAGVKSWPGDIELEGFTYDQLGGSEDTGEANIARRKINEFTEWLSYDKTFSPQSYEYLAGVLQRTGFPSKANSILHAGRIRLRRMTWEQKNIMRCLGLILLQSIIGFGLGSRYFRVLFWLIGISAIGFLVLNTTSQNATPDYFSMAWSSFDATLPIIELNEYYSEFILDNSANWVKTWFYIQKMIGYVLGGFIVAGLAGLTQKNS